MKEKSSTPMQDPSSKSDGDNDTTTTKGVVESNEENKNPKEQENTLTIKVFSNKTLFDVLDDWSRVWKIVAALIVMTVSIFLGLAIVTITLKHIYPYNDIKINMFGATTLQNEESEVNYWLFNTADLWANSGIRVKAGDRLTIRASGKFHTAIHHLYEETKNNVKLSDGWSDTGGDRGSENKRQNRDIARAKYRIFPKQRPDALLMQVVPEKYEDFLKNSRDSANYSNEIDEFLIFNEDFLPDSITLKKGEKKYERKQKKENFYLIGKEHEDLMIYEDGVLHFAVNDIVLTPHIIDKINDLPDTIWNSLEFKRSGYPDSRGTKENSELTYYQKHNYYNAWFDDNVGSFLIVIERKKKL